MAALTEITKSSFKIITQSQTQLLFSRGFSSTLFVKGISFSSTEKRIEEAFSEFGEVVEAKVIKDKTRNRHKGYGFVTFDAKNDAEKACKAMNGKLLDGRAIYVDFES